MKIILVGGGTAGPLVPLIAVAEKIKDRYPKTEFLMLGTHGEFESRLAEKYSLSFQTVPAGKLRRYFSWQNVASPFLVAAGFVKSLFILQLFRPDILFSAGGYVSVPVMFAAWVLRKKIVIHQQDVLPSVSNKILAPLADKITVTFRESLKDFSTFSGVLPKHTRTEKIVWTGNPFREDLLPAGKLDAERVKIKYGLNFDLPVLLVLGGGTGAKALNKILLEAIPELLKYVQVLHITGKGKGSNFTHGNYRQFEFTENIGEMYFIADLVMSRGGLSTITEISVLKKAAIIVPMPDSHQESNAAILAAAGAAVCILQTDLNAERLTKTVRNLLVDYQAQRQLKERIGEIMPADAAQKIADIMTDLCHVKK